MHIPKIEPKFILIVHLKAKPTVTHIYRIVNHTPVQLLILPEYTLDAHTCEKLN